MDFQTFNKLYDSMHRITAREMLRTFTTSDYPYINDKKSKKKLHRDVYKIAYPENFEEKVLKTTDLELF